MKKFFLFLVTLLLSVNNLTQADMLVSTKDSVVTVVDSAESEILHFSNAEISRIIKDSESLNPKIQNLSVIAITDTVVMKINDSTVYTFSPSRGESCWKRLQAGVKKEDLKLIKNLYSTETEKDFGIEKDVILSQDFIDKIHSNLRKTLPVVTTFDSSLIEEESVFMTDSSLTEKKSLVSTDSNLLKKESVVSISSNLTKKSKLNQFKEIKKISLAEKKELKKEIFEAPASFNQKKEDIDTLVSDSSVQKEDGYFLIDSAYVGGRRPIHKGLSDGNNFNPKIFTPWEIFIGIIVFLIVLSAVIKGWKKYKQSPSFINKQYLKELKKEQEERQKTLAR